jgi:hypothetical protein
VAVQELEPAVGQFVGQQAAGEADLPVQGLQGGLLQVGVQPEVQLVGDQVAGADAAAALVDAFLAGLGGPIQEAAQGDGAEQGGDGVGVLAAAAVAVALLAQARGRLGPVVRFEPIELPLEQLPGEGPHLAVELLLEGTGGLRGDGSAAEVLEELAELFQVGQEWLPEGLQGEEGLQQGGCQEPEGEARVSHNGVLSR